MLKTIEGVYRDGKIELAEPAGNIPEETPVIVTFLEPRGVDLRARGIDEVQAADIRARLAAFAEDGETPEMALYDDYDAAKARL